MYKRQAKRKALSSKLLQYQKDMPEENVKMLYKLLARTGDPKVLDMMEDVYKRQGWGCGMWWPPASGPAAWTSTSPRNRCV